MTDANTAPPPSEDRRAKPRQRTLKGGRIAFGHGSRTIDCQIRNMTDTGAKLTFTSTIGVPDEFDLLVPSDQRAIGAKAVWRTGRDIGIAFTGGWRDQHIPT